MSDSEEETDDSYSPSSYKVVFDAISFKMDTLTFEGQYGVSYYIRQAEKQEDYRYYRSCYLSISRNHQIHFQAGIRKLQVISRIYDHMEYVQLLQVHCNCLACTHLTGVFL